MTYPAQPAGWDDRKLRRYAVWLLDLVADDKEARAALRRAGAHGQAHRAYAYLAPWWAELPDDPRMRAEMVLHASVAATHPRLGRRDGRTLGRMAAGLTFGQGSLSPAGVEQRLAGVQRQPLPVAHRMLNGLYAAGASRGAALDWADLLGLYLRWDGPQGPAARQQLLLDFHMARAAPPRPAAPDAPDSSDDTDVPRKATAR
jgi:CRISPR type I-E-associated protein CasB/Cse2